MAYPATRTSFVKVVTQGKKAASWTGRLKSGGRKLRQGHVPVPKADVEDLANRDCRRPHRAALRLRWGAV